MKIFYKGLLTLILVSMVFTSCDTNCVSGSGDKITTALDLDDVLEVVAYGNMKINIQYAEEQSVSVVGHPNIIDLLNTRISGGVWHIGFNADCVSDLDLTVNISVPDIEKIEMIGSGNIVVDDFLGLHELDMRVVGSGHILFNELNCEIFNIYVEGSGEVYANDVASVEMYNATVIGSGKIDTYNVIGEECIASVIGSGGVNLTAIETLDAEIDGSGIINYMGNATVTKHIVGSGTVIDKN